MITMGASTSDTSQMYLLFQALSSKISPNLGKNVEFDIVLAKVFLLFVFVGNKIEEKYHINFSPKHGAWSF
jgi:hypothetical protein